MAHLPSRQGLTGVAAKGRSRANSPIKGANVKRNLLLERDFLLFDAWDAFAQPEKAEFITFRKTASTRITLSVYGSIGTSDLTGEKTVEDMEVCLGDGEITNGLPESFLQSLVHECVEEN